MTQEQKQKIQSLAEAEIRHSFQFIKNQTDKEGKDLVAYYFFLVDDFFAANNAGVTRQDIEAWKKTDDYDPEYDGLLNAIWSGVCELYEGDFIPVSETSENWLDSQPALYKEAYLLVEGLDDYDKYNKIRADFEQCIIDALKKCDEEGVFGNRKENGLLLFAFYSDDYDENGEGALLYRSAEALNDKKGFENIIK
ncbi:hypothetical protein CGC58_05355 [Capnocytophaga stomatis]|uniref:DUF4303 domain-containing protein n=1 Tax=Capnocytophaga stomatis TaxID=1848904 RepID=A0A250FVJ7_9FLAO|nr:DUF4303 domain-containing protein [Capnocytophaga stomatis]ATA89199.1 hypothetical protein CGC58_05355 [Capnocytophaga stomatis]